MHESVISGGALDLAAQLGEEGQHEVVALLGAAAAGGGLHEPLEVQQLLEEVVVGRVAVVGADRRVLLPRQQHLRRRQRPVRVVQRPLARLGCFGCFGCVVVDGLVVFC